MEEAEHAALVEEIEDDAGGARGVNKKQEEAIEIEAYELDEQDADAKGIFYIVLQWPGYSLLVIDSEYFEKKNLIQIK